MIKAGDPTLHLEGRMDAGSAPAMIKGVISLFRENPRALAAAMSLAMSEISANIINDLYHFLAARN